MTDSPNTPPKSFQEGLKEGQRLKATLAALRGELSDRVSAKHSELSELTETHDRLAELQKQVEDFFGAQVQWADERQGLLEETRRLREEHAELVARHEVAEHDLKAALEEARQDRASHEEQTRTSHAERAELRQQLAAVSEELESLRALRDQWATERASLVDARDEAGRRQSDFEQKWHDIQTQLAEQRAKVSSDLETVQKKLDAALKDSNEARSEREKLVAERSRLYAGIGRLELDAQDYRAEARVERERLMAELQDARRQLSELQALRQGTEDLEKARAATERRADVFEHELQVRQAAHEAEVRALREELASNDTELETQRAAHVQLTMERQRLVEEGDAAHQRLAELEEERRDAEERLESEKLKFAEHVAGLQRQLQAARDEFDALKETSQKWQQEWNDLLGELSRLEGEVKDRENEFRTERQSLQTELQDARAKLSELEKVREDRDQLKSAVAEHQGRTERLDHDAQAQRESLLAEIGQLRGELATKAAATESLAAQWSAERDGFLRRHEADAALHLRSEREAQERQARLSEEKGKLEAQLAILQERLQATRDELTQLKGATADWRTQRTQLGAVQAQVDGLQAAQKNWESEREGLLADRKLAEQQWKHERESLETQLTEISERLEHAEERAGLREEDTETAMQEADPPPATPASREGDGEAANAPPDDPATPEESRPAA